MLVNWRPYDPHTFSLEQAIHIWRVQLPLAEEDYQLLWELLNEKEKAKAKRFYFAKDKYQLIAASGILRRLLATYLQMSAANIQLQTNRYGKPFLEPSINPHNIQFNLTHSHQCVLLAFLKNHSIGIDVEFLQEKDNYLELAERFFSQNEYQQLKSLPIEAKKNGFYRAWTCKEAYIKARGMGLSYHLSAFSISVLPKESARLLHDDLDPNAPSIWNFYSFTPGAEYLAALATTSSLERIVFLDWNRSNFPEL